MGERLLRNMLFQQFVSITSFSSWGRSVCISFYSAYNLHSNRIVYPYCKVSGGVQLGVSGREKKKNELLRGVLRLSKEITTSKEFTWHNCEKDQKDGNKHGVVHCVEYYWFHYRLLLCCLFFSSYSMRSIQWNRPGRSSSCEWIKKRSLTTALACLICDKKAKP